MNISQVLQFEGPIDSLVWKNPIEDFNTTSVLVVDETHEALLVVNGNACDLFGPGRHTLETPNIPLVKRIINIPTDGKTSFPCKVFFINKVHQMDLTWGIPGEITLNDPIYDIFLHVGMCGNMNFQVMDARKFMLKMVGFRDTFDAEGMVSKFRGIIKQYVKSYISKIMNVGKVSYFDMNENLFEISEVVREQLRPLFEDYGIDVLQFNIESITVPDEDFEAVKKAKELRASRMIQGYTWQEERQMDIAQTFAGNEGTMGNMGGVVGGFMMGGAFGGSIADIARNALSPDGVPTQSASKDLRGQTFAMDNRNPKAFDVAGFVDNMGKGGAQAPAAEPRMEAPASTKGKFCANCGHPLSPGARFCEECGAKVEQSSNICSGCGYVFTGEAKFCPECGTKRG
ncbi:MAG: SPFH domain-containing protein [bacterium]|nr:SPFH domain-containing protein [bacterium]MCM1373490.1 SPFH domain-containing protein [Muribaculum sp.]